MFTIDRILVDDNAIRTRFSCDLPKCKGGCCTFVGDLGAPLIDEEIDQIEESVPAASQYLFEQSKQILETEGFVDGFPGSYTTKCIGRRDCVFVFYESGVAKCALERAYFDGKTSFRKPISCHLFPIRVGKFGGKFLYLEKIKECDPGYEKGNKHSISMIAELKDAFIRSFGNQWYQKLVEIADGYR